MITDDAAAGCLDDGLVASSDPGGTEPIQAAASSATDTSDRESAPQATLADGKSAAAWLGLCQALTKASCLTSSTATPLSEPSLSEVSSSHGGLTPRGETQEKPCRASPMRWADETIGLDDDDDEQEEPGSVLEQGTDPATPSKRSRRSNRRRRARAEKAAAAHSGLLLGGCSPGAKDLRQAAATNSTVGSNSVRKNSVTVGDLFCMSPTHAKAQSHRTASAGQEEAGWFVPVSPCHPQSGPMGIMSTSPCGANAGHLSFGFDCSNGYIAGSQSPTACLQPFFAVLVSDPGAAWMSNSPATPCRALNGPSGIVSTSPHGMEASARTPPPLPVGPVNHGTATPLSSPCHARVAMANGIVSTSPTSGSNTANAIVPQGKLGEASYVDPAGSPTADALRSWLHASGLPSCADLAHQLRAAAQEAYED